MANSYTQLYVQYVFAVQGRKNLIPPDRKEEVHKYITGIVSNRGQKMLAIHCMPDHIHIFAGIQPTQRISDLVRDIKTASSSFIRSLPWMKHHFKWQSGYAAFTYGHSQIPHVCRYIENQVEHHRQKSFREEYLEFLEKFHVDYDDQYLFDWIDEGS